MSISMHPQKIQNIQNLSDKARCDYFVRKVADFRTVWGLGNTGWATARIDEIAAIPFWPEMDFAALCATDEWQGFAPKPIMLNDFLLKWLPGMQADHRKCLIFPIQKNLGLILPPMQLHDFIEDELRQYDQDLYKKTLRGI
jgi:hypothetical protein